MSKLNKEFQDQLELSLDLSLWHSGMSSGTYAVCSCMQSDAERGIRYDPRNHHGHVEWAFDAAVTDLRREADNPARPMEEREEAANLVVRLRPYAPLEQDEKERQFQGFFRGYLRAALWTSADEEDNKKRAVQEKGGDVWRPARDKPFWVWAREDPDGSGGPFSSEGEAWEDAFQALIGGEASEPMLDEHYTPDDFDASALLSLREKVCYPFFCQHIYGQVAAEAVTPTDGDPWATLGYCLWLSSQGHGICFGDHLTDEGLAGKLEASVREMRSEIYFYVSDGNKIHLENAI